MYLYCDIKSSQERLVSGSTICPWYNDSNDRWDEEDREQNWIPFRSSHGSDIHRPINQNLPFHSKKVWAEWVLQTIAERTYSKWRSKLEINYLSFVLIWSIYKPFYLNIDDYYWMNIHFRNVYIISLCKKWVNVCETEIH